MLKDEEEELALLTQLRKGDADALAHLVGRYQASLMRVASGFVSSLAVAEDVVQETWLAVIKGMSRFEGRSSFRTWLFSIVVNRAKTRGVQEHRTMPFSALGEAGSLEPAVVNQAFDKEGRWAAPPRSWGADSPEEMLLRNEMQQVLTHSIAALPERYRVIITLRDIEEIAAQDVCQLLDINEQNQRVLLHRARARLRSMVEAQFIGELAAENDPT